MELAVIGVGLAGKTTVFNALTGGHAATGTFAATSPNIGVVRVPDPRVDRLAHFFHPKRNVYAEITYLDFPGSGASFGRGEGPGGAYLAALGQADALVHVVRLFADPAVPHPEGSLDPARDISTMDLELAFADLAVIERRLQRLDTQVRSAKAGEREAGQRELALLQRIKAALEAERPLRDQGLGPDEAKLIQGFGLLTARPVLLVLNVGEEDLSRVVDLEAEFQQRYGSPTRDVVSVCGKLEQDLAQMTEQEAEELRSGLGLQEAGSHRVIRLSYSLLGLISFLTVGPDECRAWTIREGATAQEAAAAIHSDLARGFIRAEVINWEDLVACGSYAEARRRGLLRSEGKGYVVRDGDVLHILFNV